MVKTSTAEVLSAVVPRLVRGFQLQHSSQSETKDKITTEVYLGDTSSCLGFCSLPITAVIVICVQKWKHTIRDEFSCFKRFERLHCGGAAAGFNVWHKLLCDPIFKLLYATFFKRTV